MRWTSINFSWTVGTETCGVCNEREYNRFLLGSFFFQCYFSSLYLSRHCKERRKKRSSFHKRKNNGKKNGNEIYGWNHMEQIAFISRLSFVFVEINSQSIYLIEHSFFLIDMPRQANVHTDFFLLSFFHAVTCFSCHLWIYDLAIFYWCGARHC